MLLNYDQFLVRQAIRSQATLSNPRVVPSTDISLPRQSVIHYLDYTGTDAFPSRKLNYLNDVPPNKKVPVLNVMALNHTVDVTVIQNRTLDKDARVWQKNNMQDFRPVDLLVIPNADTQTHSLINYQNLKDLYKYKSSAVSQLSRYNNVYQTYWESVHKAIEVDPTSHHFVHIPLTSLIPSKGLLDNLLKAPESTYARVVHNPDLNGIIQLYKYLNPLTRDTSTMRSLTEQDCSKVNVEFSYQGYSCFFNLAYLVSLGQESTLESKRKLNVDQLGRLYLLMVLKVQKAVFDLQSGQAVSEVDTNTIDSPEDYTESDENKEQETKGVDANVAAIINPSLATSLSTKNPTQVDDADISQSLNSLADIPDMEISELEGDSDDVFAKLMEKEDEPLVDTSTDSPDTEGKDKEVQLVVNYSPEHKTTLLTDKTLDENLQSYIDTAKTSGSVSSAEIRALRKVFDTRKTMKSPYDEKPIDEFKTVTAKDVEFTEEDTKLDIKNNLVDDELKGETLFNFDRLYLDKLLKKDIIGCVTQIEQAGIIIKDYQVETNDSALGSYEVHKLTLKPYKGKESTVYFRIPVINEEGEFKASGIDYRMRKQRQD